MAKRVRPEILTFDEAHALFAYDPLTGEMVRRITVANNAKAGDRLKCCNAAGYRVVRAFGRLYRTSRIIWLMQTGAWPDPKIEVDHKSGNQSDERWDNLRAATRSKNESNKPKPKSNTSGFKGVYFNKLRSKWYAQIHADGRWYGLGYHLTKEAAAAAYEAKARELVGEFYRSC